MKNLKLIMLIASFLLLHKMSSGQSSCQLTQNCANNTAISCNGTTICIGNPHIQEINCDGYVWDCNGAKSFLG